MLSQTEWLLHTVLEFYREPTHLDTLLRISNMAYTINSPVNYTIIPSTISEKVDELKHPLKRISVRIVNWFVSNYAKQHMTTYTILRPKINGDPPTTDLFFVWNRYCAAKDGYASKDMFDPYCRKGRVAVQCEDGTVLNTTIGQLNFFKWAIQNKIIDYISEHYDDIVRDMGARITAKMRHPGTDSEELIHTTGKRTRKKREELSVSACRSLTRISLISEVVDVDEHVTDVSLSL